MPKKTPTTAPADSLTAATLTLDAWASGGGYLSQRPLTLEASYYPGRAHDPVDTMVLTAWTETYGRGHTERRLTVPFHEVPALIATLSDALATHLARLESRFELMQDFELGQAG